jgi:ABC-type dipeptide/oligopeptide/nickel transport system permease component
MKRVLALAMPVFAVLAVAALLCAVVLFRVEIAAFLGTHAWWQDVLALLSAVAVPILAYFELRHSAEANHMRREANELRIEANAASLEANRYRDEANEQR